VEPLACAPGDDDEARRRKVLFALTSVLIVPAGLLWGALLAVAFDARAAALIPLGYAVLTLADVALLVRLRRFAVFRRTQMALMLLLPAALHVAMGGFVASGAVVVWSFVAVMMAVLFAGPREAPAWWAAFVATVVAVAVLEPGLNAPDGIPGWRLVVLFVLNIGVVSSLVFAVVRTFMEDRRRLRELELAYLNQDLMLRQSEKLATLGTLAAGVAHELNNPAAATARGADRLRGLMAELTAGERDGQGDEGEARRRIAALRSARDGRLVSLSPLQRSDREDEIAGWLRELGFVRPSEVAAALVDLGHTRDELEPAVAGVAPERRAELLAGVARAGAAERLVAEIGEGAGRISQIVSAMRSYTNLDRAPVGEVDVVDGIESTLVLLAGRLRGVVVQRDYAEGLPRVEANGGELNQVWTNIIENAVHAMGGAGTLTLRAAPRGDDAVRVEIGDDGPGMPPEVAARVFDAFFTTKAPGEGTGLGLNISHNIIVAHHGGTMEVETGPTGTTFLVTLPRRRPATDGGQPSVR
jgi:signal transduction histidine kinase